MKASPLPISVSGKNILYKQVDRELWLEGFPSHAKFKGPILGDMFQTFEAAGCEQFLYSVIQRELTYWQSSAENS
jgi:hypothetical protein